MPFSNTLIHGLTNGLGASLVVSSVFIVLLMAVSLAHLSRTGPQIRDEVMAHYRGYLIWSLTRLGFWAWLIASLLAAAGNLVWLFIAQLFSWTPGFNGQLVAAGLGIITLSGLRFISLLWHSPSTLTASFNYSYKRLARLWGHLNAHRLSFLHVAALSGGGALLIMANFRMIDAGKEGDALVLDLIAVVFVGLSMAATWLPEPRPYRSGRKGGPPNILLIGSDTLRADRLGGGGYHRVLTPNIDALAARGTHFSDCYVPCARTAPSLVSLFSGCWPHTHGIRDNYISDKETRIQVPVLPHLLKQSGYRTAAVSDWCGSDLDKFPFGFDHKDFPADQWNLKFFLRQGPKDLRLFLSLFCHNRLGKRFLPEVHYLAGVPLNRQVGRDARSMLRRLARRDEPFLLNVFMAATHPPFGSEYPYYMRFADPAYMGESKFVMARLTDPWEILRRQADPKESFDLDQVIDLYDGCVTDFDDQVGKMLTYLDACGLRDNTLVVVYSDHGFEFFEHGTWGQGNSAIGDVSARIPLIMSGPGIPAGRKVSQIVRSVDIAPTLLDLIGQGIPSNMDGTSLKPCMSDQETNLDLPAFNETGMWLTRLPVMPDKHLDYPNLMELLEVADKQTGTLGIRPKFREIIVRAKDRMIRVGRWKMTYEPMVNGPQYQLFDLGTDPECRLNLADTNSEVRESLKALLLEWLQADPLFSTQPTGRTCNMD